VIDNINYLATTEPRDLEMIQNTAKEWADAKVVQVVFVSSDGAAPPQLEGRSSYSRAAEYFIGGIPEPVAINYLVDKKKYSHDLVVQIFKHLTGDQLHLILAVAEQQTSADYKAIQKHIFSLMAKHVESLFCPQRRLIAKIISAILQSPLKSISIRQFNEIVEHAVLDVA